MGEIKKAAVIGAGVMGSGIAAHLANAGVEVTLLDLDAALAASGVARQLKAGGFMDPKFAARISTGATGTDLAKLADADWIVEAVAERPDIKRTLYKALEGVRKPGSVVSSNTSTIRLAALLEGASDEFARNFLITHFFNPPRRMRLLEIVTGPATDPKAAQRIMDFADIRLGKTNVVCKDTPGFIANRIGNLWIIAAQNEAIEMGLDVEEADAIMGKPFGIPGSGIFGLLDLVGIDLVPMAVRSLQQALPTSDAAHNYDAEPPLIARMVSEGRTGRKGGSGFMRMSADKKKREILDLTTGEYRPMRKVASPALEASGGSARALMEHPSKGGRYAAKVMEATLAYAASLVPEIADSPADIDEAMRLGYAWKEGPFELIERLGADWLVARLERAGTPVPAFLALAASNGGFYKISGKDLTVLLPDGSYRTVEAPAGTISFPALKRAGSPVLSDDAANLWDISEGVACIEIRTKMGTFTGELLAAMERSLERVQSDFQALVVASSAPVFSAGANLTFVLAAAESGDTSKLIAFMERGQKVFRDLKFAPYPVVSAAYGLALGGGCEIALHSDVVQAHAELAMGLVEPKVGIIPAWGGCKEMFLRAVQNPQGQHGPTAHAITAFNVIAPGIISSSAFDARNLGFLRPQDLVTMNIERLIGDARQTALRLVKGYRPPEPAMVSLAGPAGAAAIRVTLDGELQAGRISAHDAVIGAALASVLTGGPNGDPAKPVIEDTIAALERDAFLELLATEPTRERIRHMLATGKPLRN